MTTHTHVYRIDCSALSPEEYENFYAACDRLAFLCSILPGRPRCFEVTWNLAEPLTALLPLPKGCAIQEIL